MDPRSFLIKHGLLEPHVLPHNEEFRIECPKCGHHNKKCYVNAAGKGVHCFHCPFQASWYGFTRLFEPPTPGEAALESFVAYAQEELKQAPQVKEYLLGRGLTEDVIERSRLGYLSKANARQPQESDISVGLYSSARDSWTLEGRIIIPYIRDGYVTGVRGRAYDEGIDPKYMGLKGSHVQIYMPSSPDYTKPLFICEGEFDAMIMSAQGYQAVGIPGTQTGQDYMEQFQKFTKIYLCLDGDEAGRKACIKLRRLFPEVYEVVLPQDFDLTDYLLAFGKDSLQDLIDNALFYVGGKLQEDDSLRASITSWEDWAWSNSDLLGPKIGWAPRLESALSGWSKGLFLIGAIANSGKSCFLVKSAYEAALHNPDDTVVVYLSLDDDQEDALCRLASLHTGVSFEELRTPRVSFDHPTDKNRQNPSRLKYVREKLNELKSLNNLFIRDARFGRSLNYIRIYTALLRKRYPEKHIVLFIDSLAKLTAENEPSDSLVSNWKAHLANELKYLSTLHSLCIVTPADFRKLNDSRRPTNDDLKDAAELAYEANCVLLGFNEVSLKGLEEATLKWQDSNTGQEWPILELNLSKNKKSMYRGVIRYKFYPPTSDFVEIDEKTDLEFTRKIKENEQRRTESKRGWNSNSGSNNWTPGGFSTDLSRFNNV